MATNYIYSFDLSISSPAVCKWSIDGVLLDVLYFTYNKEKINVYKNIQLDKKSSELLENRWHRYNLLSKYIFKFCVNPITIISEGHSYGSNGRVVDLANFNGCVIGTILNKYSECDIIEYSPSSIKLSSTNYGLADKVKMRLELEKQYPDFNKKLLKIQKDGKYQKFDTPLEDIVDSFWIGIKYFNEKNTSNL